MSELTKVDRCPGCQWVCCFPGCPCECHKSSPVPEGPAQSSANHEAATQANADYLNRIGAVTQGEPERPWTCDTCGTQFAEYVNGCPKCWDNGKLSSVRQSPAQPSPVVQTEKHFDQIKSSLQAALSHIKGELYRLPASDKSRVSAQKDILSGLIGRLNAAVSDLDAITSLAPVVPVEETAIEQQVAERLGFSKLDWHEADRRLVLSRTGSFWCIEGHSLEMWKLLIGAEAKLAALPATEKEN